MAKVKASGVGSGTDGEAKSLLMCPIKRLH